MILTLAVIWRKGVRDDPARQLISLYLERAKKYMRVHLEEHISEASFVESVARRRSRTSCYVLMADCCGKLFTSEEIAETVERQALHSCREFLFAIGPADGWSDEVTALADECLSFGHITLPHELAAAVAAEQLYRALTIRAKHPYHKSE